MLQPVLWIAALPALAAAHPVDECSTKPPAFFLAGDSTTAIEGGWGNGLLAPLIKPAWGVNIGKSGATTASFVGGGYWDNVTTHLRENADKFDCYVTISFGHNDQKPNSGVTFEEYQANLIRFANEVKSLGGIPLLTSSLTRRAFPSDSEHNATDSLHNERLAAIEAAKETHSTVIDLNAASLAYVNAIGKQASWEYNYGDDKKDTTHFNARGEAVFGRMVVDLVIRAKPSLKRWFTPNNNMSYAIWHNLPA
ncbi:hypothetical protein AAE478_001296 [Parahypoxylon ruwenzoriense]